MKPKSTNPTNPMIFFWCEWKEQRIEKRVCEKNQIFHRKCRKCIQWTKSHDPCWGCQKAWGVDRGTDCTKFCEKKKGRKKC